MNKKQQQEHYWFSSKKSRRSAHHPTVRGVFEPFAKKVSSLLAESKNSSVLDVGCGNGFFQYSLEKEFIKVVGVDYSQKMLAVNPCKEKYFGLATKLSFDKNSFDIVVASGLLHHLIEKDRILALQEMKRVAKKYVVSIEPNRNNLLMYLFALLKKQERMALKFSKEYMLNIFMQSELKVSESYVDNWLLPNVTPNRLIFAGKLVNKTFMKNFGFSIVTIAKV